MSAITEIHGLLEGISPEASLLFIMYCADESKQNVIVCPESKKKRFDDLLEDSVQGIFDHIDEVASKVSNELITEVTETWAVLHMSSE